MKIVILIYQIIQEKFAYGELFMLVMIGYIFKFKMVKKMQNSGFKIVAGFTSPLKMGVGTTLLVVREPETRSKKKRGESEKKVDEKI